MWDGSVPSIGRVSGGRRRSGHRTCRCRTAAFLASETMAVWDGNVNMLGGSVGGVRRLSWNRRRWRRLYWYGWEVSDWVVLGDGSVFWVV